MNKVNITDRQQKVLDFIKYYIDENGYSPSVREIGAGLGLKSTATVHQHLEYLERAGRIKRKYGASRAIRIIEQG